MFKWLFFYWFNFIDTPFVEFKFNIWLYINIKIFKLKLINQIIYNILILNYIFFKKLKIFYKNLFFEFFYIKLMHYIFFSIIIIIFL